MRRVTVTASRTYDILIGRGLINDAGKWIAQAVKPCQAALITDDIVDGLYGGTVERSLKENGFGVHKFVFPNGEQSKTWQVLGEMLEFMAGEQLTRGDIVVALGGGVTGDMAGFAAAVYARGIRFVQIPTTLLAAVDSSVGGKTAVDLKAAKNMAGAFCQPSQVLIDCDVLEKLPDELVGDGAAEIIKYGVLADRDLFETMRRGRLMENLEDIVEKCVTIKRDVVAEDEFDNGARQCLNLGHTLGHAVEKNSNFTLTHGKGVSVGMMLIARAAWKKGYSEENLVPAIEEAVRAYGLPTKTDYSPEELARVALVDKKRRGGEITLVVPKRIGKCDLIKVPVGELAGWAAQED
ncbi:MAG: 3-dehydroquinate synthase [Clostridia bacterium]|nr:3-dehydroquinate synthase [Clostridia bacterium]